MKINFKFVIIVFILISYVTKDFGKSLVYTQITIETIEWISNRLK